MPALALIAGQSLVRTFLPPVSPCSPSSGKAEVMSQACHKHFTELMEHQVTVLPAALELG